MANKRAFITGLTGQDGGHLTELLLSKGYDVAGMIRGQQNPKTAAFVAEFPEVKVYDADLIDVVSMTKALKDFQPEEIYNLAAISHVGYSFKNPILTHQVTGGGVINLLSAIMLAGLDQKARFYQASTSEMFGGLEYNRPEKGYTEESSFHPRSPYGVAKVYGHWITKNYRESYGMHASCGILFNHEGERRGVEFVTRKITDGVAKIKLGHADHIELGDLWPKRDWGYAGDYVEGMWRMVQQEKPDDFVLATGETHSIEDFLSVAFAEVGIDDWKPYVKQNPAFMRPAEVDLLLGDPTKAQEVLGWERKVDFPSMVKLMVERDLELTGKS